MLPSSIYVEHLFWHVIQKVNANNLQYTLQHIYIALSKLGKTDGVDRSVVLLPTDVMNMQIVEFHRNYRITCYAFGINMTELTREEMIKAAKSAAHKVGSDLSRADFLRETGISEHQINKLFPEGRWTELKSVAGLERNPRHRVALEDDEIIKEFHRVASECGAVPTWAIFTQKAEISADVVRRRFGGLQGTLKAYREWLEMKNPGSPLLEHLHAKSRHEIPTPPVTPTEKSEGTTAVWEKVDGTIYGAPIDFRGLRHAPVNEQGVVFLFGMVAFELGFIVEAVHASFPDCEAKRCIDSNNQRWQRVLIEFEYRSRTFRDHGHDPDGCDLIICWEHNWPECPLPVLELRKIIDSLEG